MSDKSSPLNTAPIIQFIQQVKSADNSRAKEVKMDITTAKNLTYTLGIVLARLNGNLEELITSNAQGDTQTIEINLDTGNNW